MGWTRGAFLAVFAAGCGARRESIDLGAGDAGPSCASGEIATGCPCDVPEPRVCYSGPAGTEGIGACRPGVRVCVEGAWGPCDGETIPAAESLGNAIDDDCDGRTDEDPLDPCANGCVTTSFGSEPGDLPFDVGVDRCLSGGDDLRIDERPGEAAWIPDSAQGTVSLVDPRERVELARFRTGPGGATDDPSAIDIDPFSGDVFVANQSPGGQASVTRIRKVGCLDTDGDALLDSSTGPDDVLPWGEDECVAWNTPVGDVGAVASAVVLVGWDLGALWIGLENEMRFVELDPATGEATGREVDCAPCEPSGARFDLGLGVWSACTNGSLCRFDSDLAGDVEVVDRPGTSGRDVAFDREGRVWVDGDVAVLDPESGVWSSVPDVVGRGLVFLPGGRDPDEVWVAGCDRPAAGLSGGTCIVATDTLEVESLAVASRAIDEHYEFVWAVTAQGSVTEVDLDTRETETFLDDCDGGGCFDGPDPSGRLFEGIVFDEPTPRCLWHVVVEGCGPGLRTRWSRISWEATDGWLGDLVIRARTAGMREALAAARFVDVGRTGGDVSEALLEPLLDPDAETELLEVEVELEPAGGITGGPPVLQRLSIEHSCE